MKILILNDYPSIVGGAERFLENLVHEAGASTIEFDRLDIAELAATITPVAESSFLATRIRRIRIFPELVRLIIHRMDECRPDLIHLNNNNLFTNTVLRSLMSAKIPVVSFIHDEYALRRLHSPFYIDTSGKFTFLTHSADIHHDLTRARYNVHLVKVPFNHARWKMMEDERHRPAKTDLLYVGRIETAKGVFKLIAAIERIKKKIPAIRVTFLGDGSKMDALRKIVSRKKLSANVELKGMQNDQEILDYYLHSRILVFPSAVESLGYVGLEAQACGVPVVAFENKGTARWCRDNQSGFLVRQGSAQKLADKVLEIIHDDVILTRISTAARENIRREGYNASKQEITDIYKAILSV